MFLGINLASCDPLSAVLAESQLGPLESPWPFCLEPGNLSRAQGWGDQTCICRRDGLRQWPHRGKGVCSPQTFGRLSPGLVDGQGSFSLLWGHSQGSGLGSRRKCRLAVSRPEMPEQMGWDGGMEGSEQCSLALIQLACASSPMVSHPPQDIVAKANAK